MDIAGQEYLIFMMTRCLILRHMKAIAVKQHQYCSNYLAKLYRKSMRRLRRMRLAMLVLRDLSSGGTGWGLCDGGVGACENSYFSAFELVAGLILALFALLGVLAILLRALRILQKRQAMKAAGVPMGIRDTGSLWTR